MKVFRRAAWLALAVVLCSASPASAHIIENQRWLVSGSTYNKDQPNDEAPRKDFRKDPVSVIWKGPNSATVSIGSVIDHTNDHWDGRRINPDFPGGKRMKKRTKNPFCTDAQKVFMRNDDGVQSAGAWQSSRGYMSTNGACTNQYHIRLWNSDKHADAFGASHRFEWVLSPIHYDRVVIDCKFRIVPCRGLPRHDGPIPWDSTRAIYYNMMKKYHCGKFHWRVHPESENVRHGRFLYSGIVSRISQKHKPGCSGA